MRERLGQHFLTDTAILRKIAAVVDPRPGETIIEVGPGHGELTDQLLAVIPAPDRGRGQAPAGIQTAGSRIRSGMTELICIERDPKLTLELKEKYKDIEIIEGDILEILPTLTYNLTPTTYKLVGNLPYYLTGHLLRAISELDHKPIAAVFTVQKEVAERMVARPPQMNRLAAAVQFWAEPKITGLISRRDFSPPPKVDSATILLTTRIPPQGAAESAAYYKMLRILFQQPRKTISNNLLAAGLNREEITECLARAGISPDSRPQNLAVEDVAKLAGFGFAGRDHLK